MLEIVAEPPPPSAIACFPDLDSRNLNGLVVTFCLARDTRARFGTSAGKALLRLEGSNDGVRRGAVLSIGAQAAELVTACGTGSRAASMTSSTRSAHTKRRLLRALSGMSS